MNILMSQMINQRVIFISVATISILSLAFALYLEKEMDLLPCPLCMTQRALLVIVGFIAIIASLHNPQGWAGKSYWILCAIFSLLGALVAARHIWLQNLPEDLVPACGPSLEYMLQTLPFYETLQLILMGDGNCAEIVWTFAGFTIPEQTLGLFLLLALVCIWQSLKRTSSQI